MLKLSKLSKLSKPSKLSKLSKLSELSKLSKLHKLRKLSKLSSALPLSLFLSLSCIPYARAQCACWLKTSLSLPVLVTIVVTQHGVSRLGRLLLVQKAALQYVYTGRHLSATM